MKHIKRLILWLQYHRTSLPQRNEQMRHTTTLLLFVFFLCSCTHTPTRAELIEQKATEYLQRTTHPMSDYCVVAKDTESKDSIFVGFVGYRCAIEGQYSIYKVVFVCVKGDNIVYVGTNEETANRILQTQ